MKISIKMINTTKSVRREILSTLVLAPALLLLSACASSTAVKDSGGDEVNKTGSDDPVVVERSKARWTALLANDPETAYSYYSPGYRSTTSVVDFMFKQRTRRVRWVSAEYVDHSCTKEACEIIYKAGFKVSKALPGMDTYQGTDTVEETWVKTQGEWWFVPPKG